MKTTMKKQRLSLAGVTATALGILPAIPAMTSVPALAAAAPAPRQPNILIITTDQQSWNMLSAYGTTHLATPAMDRLAKNGCSFRKVYVTNPVCMPSRFSLYTGHYASEIGVKDNTPNPADAKNNRRIATEAGMGNLFRKAGYETFYSGKTHFYSPAGESQKPPELYGFKSLGFDPYEQPVNNAKKFFATRKPGDKPFLMVLSFMNPHNICSQDQPQGGTFEAKLKSNQEGDEPRRQFAIRKKLTPEQIAAQTPPMLTNTAPINGEQPGWVEMDTHSRGWTKQQWSFYRWLYYRFTESVDDQIGRALAAFYASPFVDNTIVVFTSDHGDMQGAHHLILKNVPFEECQRVPLVIVGPGIKKGFVDDTTLVCNGIDLIPTLCDLAGVKRSPTLPGKSLKGVLTGTGPAPERDCIFTETYNSYTINDGRYKYTVFELPGNPDMLVDLQTDPGELRNLVNDPASQDIKTAMKDKLMKNLATRNLLPLRTNMTLAHIREVQRAHGANKNTAPAKGGKKGKQAEEESNE